jgi:hypothetical protein
VMQTRSSEPSIGLGAQYTRNVQMVVVPLAKNMNSELTLDLQSQGTTVYILLLLCLFDADVLCLRLNSSQGHPLMVLWSSLILSKQITNLLIHRAINQARDGLSTMQYGARRFSPHNFQQWYCIVTPSLIWQTLTRSNKTRSKL